ncbi:hypothetical protein B0J17DRAFT_575649 [Rhizoctonia solani]|nr:hypothetical protein B0J17DRAFT_575649 [Rhizoctonia solani]
MPRIAIVTRAAQGILGRAIALRLVSDGTDVAVNDINPKRNELEQLVKEITQISQQAISIPGNVSKEAEVQEMVTKTVDALGSLDIMVANAGIHIASSILDSEENLRAQILLTDTHTPMSITDEVFDEVLNVNYKGVLYCYRAAAVQMIKQGRGGRIIGASSVRGLRKIAYSTSKFCVRAITQTAALEWGQYNITVNAYAPGLVYTLMGKYIVLLTLF